MQNIKNTLKLFLKKYNLNKPDLTYLVGFSGGYDSMCLLDVLHKVTPKNKIVAIHLNHGWRGVESDNEEKNCKDFCDKIGVKFYSEKLSPNIPHTETAARDARYKFFEKCSKKFKSNIIFTAHNKNDNVETVIYRICKGTGIVGLQGICETRENFYRPLLTISRSDIEKYCKKNKLSPNTDSSNSDIKYKRNFIRKKIIPQLCQINENAIEMINSLSEIAKEENSIIEEYLKYIQNKISKNGEINTAKFLNLSDAIQKKLIYKVFLNNNLDYDRRKVLNALDFIRENSKSISGKTFSLSNNLWIFTNDKKIKVITDKKTFIPYFHITKEGTYEENGYFIEVEKYTKNVKNFPKDSENLVYVDLSGFDFDFEVRTRQDGDYIYPLGAGGKQKLKKYLNEKKIPNHQKDNFLFMTQNNEILWAINLGISDKIKVVKNPTHRIKFYRSKDEKPDS